MSTFKRLNMFKKLPEDLTISTAHGSLLTLVGAVAMVLLFVLELRAFLHVSVETMIEVDDTVDTMMRINFNVTVADAPCEYLSVDLTDITGTYEHNITRHISKVRLSQWRRWIAIHPEEGAGSPAYIKPSDAELAQIDAETRGGGAVARALADALADGRDPGDAVAAADGGKALDVHGNPMGEVVALSQATTAAYVQSHDMVFVNFFAPWCHWCQELEPIWKGAAARLPDLHYGERVKMASVDCVQHVEFCRTMHIRAFPTLVLYTEHTMDASLLYTSERSTQAFFDFLEANANAKHIEHEARAEAHIAAVAHRQRTSDHGPEGCMVAGHLLAKKVPGTFHIKLHSSGYSHDALLINSSHVVHHLSFGGSGGEGDAHADGAIMDLGKSTVRNAAFAVADNGQSFVHFHKVRRAGRQAGRQGGGRGQRADHGAGQSGRRGPSRARAPSAPVSLSGWHARGRSQPRRCAAGESGRAAGARGRTGTHLRQAARLKRRQGHARCHARRLRAQRERTARRRCARGPSFPSSLPPSFPPSRSLPRSGAALPAGSPSPLPSPPLASPCAGGLPYARVSRGHARGLVQLHDAHELAQGDWQGELPLDQVLLRPLADEGARARAHSHSRPRGPRAQLTSSELRVVLVSSPACLPACLPCAQVVEREKSMPLYHFVTSLCAIIGGFFTILSLLEGTVHFSVEALSKKLS